MNFCFSQFGVWSDDFEFRSQDGGHLRDYFGIKYFFSDSHSFQMTGVERSVSFLWDFMVYHISLVFLLYFSYVSIMRKRFVAQGNALVFVRRFGNPAI